MSINNLAKIIARPGIGYRPELRWWLAEGLHTDTTLRHEISSAHRLGFGGMEFLAMDEAAVDHSRYGWGSEEWVHDSQVVVEETSARGMSVSFTSGTNWSNANLPTITPDQPAAAQELNVVIEELSAGQSRQGSLPRVDLEAIGVPEGMPMERVSPQSQSFVATVAVRSLARRPDGGWVLDTESVIDLTDQVRDDELAWTAPAGDWKLFVFWMHGTGQIASPSVSVNYTVNYLDPDGAAAVIDYWDQVVLTPQLREQIARNPRAQMYMDSLELWTFGAGGLFWGHSVAAEFRRRRGYDLVPWLPFLTRSVTIMASSTVYHHEADEAYRVTVEKVRHDFAQTLTDLYIENMLRPFAEFCHRNGMTLRAEISYGMPFELTRPGPEVDGIETESLEFGSQIDAYRLLAGPAHLFGKQYSSETGATTRNHMLDHRFYDQIIATQFAVGCTKTVLHGWASPAGAEGATEWPGHEGMWPMFSERFDTRQPASEFYPLWNQAMGRYQYLLRQGLPRIDVGILRTDHFTDNGVGMVFLDDAGNRILDEESYARKGMRNRENYWWQDLGMQDAGWSYEFLDATLLLHEDVTFAEGVVQPTGPGYQALVVYQEALDPDAARTLLEWARRGLRILFVHGARELVYLQEGRYVTHARAARRTPGRDGRDEELAQTISQLLALDSVAAIDDPAGTIDALRELGVVGRAEFVTDNRNVLTHLREEGALQHLFAYHFLYDTGAPTRVEIALEGAGIVYRVDAWTGRIAAHQGVRRDGDRTVVTVDLAPGEAALFTYDRSEPAEETEPAVEEIVEVLSGWTTRVESWDAGDLETITEDRGLGYQSVEVRPLTRVRVLETHEQELRAWSELPEIGPEVSGIGEYTTAFLLDPAPETDGRYLLDLGSTHGGLGSVQVNDASAVGFDTSRPVVDVTDALRPGRNEVRIRVASSLNNRLLARGYYEQVPDVAYALVGEERAVETHVRPHGLAGPVRLLRRVGARPGDPIE